MENIFLLALCGIFIGGAWSFYQRHQRGWAITMLLIAFLFGLLWYQSTNETSDNDDNPTEATPEDV